MILLADFCGLKAEHTFAPEWSEEHWVDSELKQMHELCLRQELLKRRKDSGTGLSASSLGSTFC